MAYAIKTAKSLQDAKASLRLADKWDGPDHFVQFYDNDDFFVESLSEFVMSGIAAGDCCIVMATGSRLDLLDEKLRARGLDVARAHMVGQYLSRDADEILSRFMIGDLPNRRILLEVFADIHRQASAGGRPVRIFAEMVALLWAGGKYDAALRLEELWNDLGKTYSFSLFCAYPMKGFGRASLTERLSRVCEQHSRVIPAENYSSMTTAEERLQAVVRLQQKARSLDAEIERRMKAEERLRISERIKDEFLATISHELRTPLNAITGWLQMLRKCNLDEAEVDRAIETIDRNARAEVRLIDDILDVSRMIVGKLHLKIGSANLAAVINNAVDAVRFAAEAKGIRLVLDVDAQECRILGDADRLQQVVWNLLSNAIKFTPPGGRVELKLGRTRSGVQITVKDSGQGINPDFLPLIFDRFTQADSRRTRIHGGLGLGLAVARHLVELHGGTIQAASPGEGQGAEFRVVLPIERAGDFRANPLYNNGPTRAGRSGQSGYTSLPSLEGIEVLVVDDDLDCLQIVAIMLRDCKATVQTASSAPEALKLLEWYRPDVLISDLAMPGEDGFSLISKVRAMESENSRVPAIALTAYVRTEDRAEALLAGFNVFIPKPIELDELVNAVASLAGSGRTLKN